MEKISGDDIHRILDDYGGSGVEVVNYHGLQDAVNFTDPLMVNFQPSPHKSKDVTEYEVNKNSTQEGNFQDVPNEDSFCSPGFLLSNWHQLFDIEDYLSVLKEKALHGRLGHSPFRGICWKLFWECLPEERNQWIDSTELFRANYEKVRNKHLTDPYQSSGVDLALNNPLSQEADSPWHQYFQDGELRNTIAQDVQRLYPEVDFFRKQEVDDMILRCLFVYAKEHPNINYKQGMHEILAPVIFVLWDNAQNVKECREGLQEIIHIMNDPNYVEHDAYCLLEEIMDSCEPMFVHHRIPNDEENNARQKVADVDNLFVSSSSIHSTTAISKKLTRIQNYMLKRYDHELYSRLQDLEIAPQVYGIRWIRLLFGREYPLTRVLYLWDAMFADGRSLALADFIFIAMLINIRSFLLKNDYSACLMHLMKYPNSTDVKMILRKALSLRSSKPNSGLNKRQTRVQNRRGVARNESLRRNLSESLTEQQKFAHVLGSGKQPAATQSSKASFKSSQWYADSTASGNNEGAMMPDSGSKRETFVQEVKRSNRSFTDLSEAKAAENRPDAKKVEKSPRTPLMKSNVVSQISNAIGKHKAGLSSDVLSKLTSRNKSRPKEDLISQLGEDHERLQKQISQLQTDYDRLQSLCLFCAGKMHSYLGFIEMSKNEAPSESEMIKSCLNGLEKVRDILAKTTDVDPSSDAYERQFAFIDKRLSESFSGKEEINQDQEEVIVISGKEDHFAESDEKQTEYSDVKEVHGTASEQPVATDEASNENGSQEDFDYLGYEASVESEARRNNSDSNFSGSQSSSSSATPEPWGYLKPIESPGDFEKELLLIKDRYGTNSTAKQGNDKREDTDLGPLAFHDAGSSNCQAENFNESSEALDPLSTLEQDFSEN